jgi:transcriptional regulator with XRE-family HTH domain
MTFAQLLREELEAADMKPSELADRVGCDKSYISQILQEKRYKSGKLIRPSVELVDSMAEALGASRRNFRLTAGYAPPAASMPPINPIMEQIERKLRRIPAEKRPTVERLVLADIDKYAASL